MQVDVIHKAFEEDGPIKVATVNVEGAETITDALEYAYRWTNNVEGSWSIKESTLEFEPGEVFTNGDFNNAVTVLAPLHNVDGKEYGLRSTSVGDEMICDGKTYKVSFVGFEEIAQ